MSYEDKSGKETKKVNAEKQTKWKTRRECRSFIIEKGGSRCTTQIMKKMIDAMVI